jgi:hypothetical protein
MGAGVASADQPVPSTPGMTWKLDHGHGHGGDWDWGDGDWNGGNWNGGLAGSRTVRRRVLGTAGRVAVGAARSVGVLTHAVRRVY